MPRVKCYNCKKVWELGQAATNRCPGCGGIVEIYYDQARANAVVEIYNDQTPPLVQPAGVLPLIDINGFAVSFPDQRRLADVAERLLDVDSQ